MYLIHSDSIQYFNLYTIYTRSYGFLPDILLISQHSFFARWTQKTGPSDTGAAGPW